MGMVILLVGLQAIPKQIYEAALMDGATGCSHFYISRCPGSRTFCFSFW